MNNAAESYSSSKDYNILQPPRPALIAKYRFDCAVQSTHNVCVNIETAEYCPQLCLALAVRKRNYVPTIGLYNPRAAT